MLALLFAGEAALQKAFEDFKTRVALTTCPEELLTRELRCREEENRRKERDALGPQMQPALHVLSTHCLAYLACH